VGKKI